jgi:hypothetical protein
LGCQPSNCENYWSIQCTCHLDQHHSKAAMSNSIFLFAKAVANESARSPHFEDGDIIVSQLCSEDSKTV